jgi:hypothetical protein
MNLAGLAIKEGGIAEPPLYLLPSVRNTYQI